MMVTSLFNRPPRASKQMFACDTNGIAFSSLSILGLTRRNSLYRKQGTENILQQKIIQLSNNQTEPFLLVFFLILSSEHISTRLNGTN